MTQSRHGFAKPESECIRSTRLTKIKWRDLFELVGLTAVVLSLVFVGLQIRQDQNLVRSDLGSRGLETLINLKLHASDPAFAKTHAKMINEPDNLTDDEMIQINNYLAAAFSLFIRECYLESRDVYAECDSMFKNDASYFFGSKYAQSWWRKNWRAGSLSPEWMNDEVESLSSDANRLMLKEMREEL